MSGAGPNNKPQELLEKNVRKCRGVGGQWTKTMKVEAHRFVAAESAEVEQTKGRTLQRQTFSSPFERSVARWAGLKRAGQARQRQLQAQVPCLHQGPRSGQGVEVQATKT